MRAMAAIGIGALGAAIVWAVLGAVDHARNPCERVARYYCHLDPKSAECANRMEVMKESVDDESPTMRSTIRQQCVTKIESLAAEGTKVP